MVDNSLDESAAFQFARAQRKKRVLFDIRDRAYRIDAAARAVAEPWLQKVVGAFKRPRIRR
jgi:hypothetical protein